jgi:thiamine pyrophosphate-dependent acetolactate synthase large subunit-like protein
LKNESHPSQTDEGLDLKTGGHWFVKILQSKGIEFVFGTTGAGMPDIQDAMVVEKPPKWIQGLHEFVTVNAASGYALASGKVGIALIDRIVGTQNAIGAFFGAYHNSSPLVVFASSNIPGVPIETGAPELHFSNFQNLMVVPWVKWFGQVNALDTMSHDVEKAFHEALSEHRAPVYLTLRQDLMAKPLSTKVSVPASQNTNNPTLSPRVPDDQTILKIVVTILAHEKPEIITSNVGRRPEAVASLVRFAHMFGIPVRERRFFMNYPTKDPLHLGFVHRYDAPKPIASSDLVIALEIGLLPHQSFGEEIDAIDLNSDPMHRQDVYAGGDYGSSLFPAKVRAACDITPTLDKISKEASRSIGAEEERKIKQRFELLTEEHNSIFREWHEKARSSFESERLDNWGAGYVINKHFSKHEGEFSWVNGAASSFEVLLQTVDVNQAGAYFGNPSGHLGVAAGMSYGVSLAYRKYENVRDQGKYKIGEITKSSRLVLCTIGDGDAIFGNIDSALWTCSHYGIGVLYVIMNNCCWGVEWPPIIESSQQWAFKARDFEFLDIDKPRIDFQKIATAFDVISYRIETIKDLDKAMPEAIRIVRNGKPVLIDLIMEKYTGAKPSTVP